MDANILKDLACEVISLGNELKAVGPTYEQLQNAFCEDSSNVENSIAAFSEKSAIITAILTNTASSEAVTEAKAAAYDRVKSIAHQCVQNWTNGQFGIKDENGLSAHLRLMEETYEAVNKPNAFGITPAQYIVQLQQLIQAKDAEIAQLQQQLQQAQQFCNQKDQTISDLTARVQILAPTS